MTPLRVQMIYHMPLERLAPKTQAAYVAAVAGLATFYHCSPDQLSPEPIRRYLHHVLVDRHRSWRSCNQVACGLRFFSTKTLGWEPLYLNLPPHTARSQLPQVLSVEALPRLVTSAKNPRNSVRLMTPSAAGLRVSEVVRLKLTAIESARRLIRVAQGKGRKDRSTLLSTRLLTELRASWQRYRPAPWVCTGLKPHVPMGRGTAQKISSHAQRTAGLRHGPGSHTLRHCFATPLLEAGVDVRTIQMVRGHQALDTTTRYLRITRQPLATVRSPFDLLPGGDPSRPTPESRHAAACPRLLRCARKAPAQRPTVGSRRSLPPLWGDLPPSPSRTARASEGDARYRGLPDGTARWARRTLSQLWVRAVRV